MKTLEEFQAKFRLSVDAVMRERPDSTYDAVLVAGLIHELWVLHQRCDELERQLRTKQSSGRYGQ